MNEVKRDVGLEILEGLREFRRGEHGRVIKVPDVNRFRCAQNTEPGSPRRVMR